MQHKITILIGLLVALTFVGFRTLNKGQRPKPKATLLKLKIPSGWPAPLYDFTANPLTQEGFDLGRKLFYDGRLSKDGNFPCASCHQQFAAFATFDHPLSHGFNNGFTTRNAQGLFNLAWKKNFMWDGGVAHLDLQPLAPLTAANEMAETIENIITKLKADPEYRKMFRAAFGDEKINTQRVTRALSQFILMMISSDSKYDRVIAGKDTFSLPEKLGYAIFREKCAGCHKEPFFTDFSYRNNGLPVNPTLNDFGRMKITGKREDSLKFMVPSLRNIRLTSPYMHDGRFWYISNVLNHYSQGVLAGPTTDTLLAKKLPLSNFEIGQITAFLYTLTDTAFVKDKRFAQ